MKCDQDELRLNKAIWEHLHPDTDWCACFEDGRRREDARLLEYGECVLIRHRDDAEPGWDCNPYTLEDLRREREATLPTGTPEDTLEPFDDKHEAPKDTPEAINDTHKSIDDTHDEIDDTPEALTDTHESIDDGRAGTDEKPSEESATSLRSQFDMLKSTEIDTFRAIISFDHQSVQMFF
jgi:hypothetical protein